MPVQPALRTLHSRLAGPLLKAAGWLTTPAHPDDYLALLDPLLSTRHPSGRVVAVRPETADATTLAIRPGRGWAGHRAGQYLPVGVEIDGAWHWRTYSLTCPERPGGLLRVTVKAVPGGRVSPRLAYRTAPGTALRLGPAQGDFTLPDSLPDRMLLLTAGSGITPAMGILRTLAACPEPRPDVVLVHCAPTPARMIFRTELRDLAGRQPWLHFHEHCTRPALGRLTPGRLVQLCPDWDERDTWACGPAAMLDAAEQHWASAGRSHRLRVERFSLTPPLPTHAADGAAASASPAPVPRRTRARPHRSWKWASRQESPCRTAADAASASAAPLGSSTAGCATCAPARCTANPATSFRPASPPRRASSPSSCEPPPVRYGTRPSPTLEEKTP
ncbi:hypothetical protein SANT12839_094610 [Streptomyces antimycoticus]|uniref:FAD-binding FR-type domain-containing protein n=1 Tax=Streptomyces antimycoticus TaxID=68175 RepID=A0A4D4KRU6_9ACTN|nr:hypothetical protein SANT12839_094610 [Streptomyces antimycoticus]